MKHRINFCLAAIVMLSFLISGCGKTKEAQPEQTAAQPANVTGEAKSAPEETSDEGRLEDDYYGYVNRNLLDHTEIPKDSNSWSYFYQLKKESYEVLNEVLNEAVKNRQEAEPDSLEQKIADLYLTAMDMEARKKPVLDSLSLIWIK